jgi:hypothetical protein
VKAFLQRIAYTLPALENPNMTENETITELLRATFHLRQELKSKVDFATPPEADLSHLAGNARRVYLNAAPQWINHAYYRRKNYPYLFSLSLPTNRFSDSSSAIALQELKTRWRFDQQSAQQS